MSQQSLAMQHMQMRLARDAAYRFLRQAVQQLHDAGKHTLAMRVAGLASEVAPHTPHNPEVT